ncbi:MAG: hypothetical protein ACLTDV_13310 [Eubacterium sp.]
MAIPVCAKMTCGVAEHAAVYRNEMRPGQWIRTLCICIFVMYVGNIIGNAVSALIAQGTGPICPLNWKNCCPREARGLPYFFLLFWHR